MVEYVKMYMPNRNHIIMLNLYVAMIYLKKMIYIMATK